MSVLYTVNPVAGDEMAFTAVASIRGGRKPLVVLSACKIALATNEAPTDTPVNVEVKSS